MWKIFCTVLSKYVSVLRDVVVKFVPNVNAILKMVSTLCQFIYYFVLLMSTYRTL